MKNAIRGQLLASSILIGASLVAAAPAFAQAVPQSTDTVVQQPNTGSPTANPQDLAPSAEADIVVTGSLIRNPNLVNSTPVSVIGADEIELRQVNVAEDLIRQLPGAVPSVGSQVNNGNGGQFFANLRNLGENRNLVLIDGVRLTPGSLDGLFDLNNIPVALIQRVDALTGGASTTYGADAIAGVLNFVTRTDFSGIDLSVANGITERGDGATFRGDLTVGANFEDGRGNAVLSVGYQQFDPVFQGQRAIGRFQVDSFAGVLGGSGVGVPSRFSGVNPTGADSITNSTPGVPNNAVQGTRQVNAAGTGFNTTGAFTPFNFSPDNIFQTPFERFNAYAAANYEISDAVEVYNRALFSKNTVSTIVAPSGAFGIPGSISLNNPFLSTAQRNAFCAFDTNPGVGYTPRFSQAECNAAATATGPGDPNYRQVDNISLIRRSVEAGPRISEYVTTFFDYRAGVRGNITSSIGYDIFGTYGESEVVESVSGYTLNSRIQQSQLVNRSPTGVVTCQNPANGCVPVNLFGPAGSITPEQVDFLTASSTVSRRVTQAQVRGIVNGDFGVVSPLAVEPISFAVGGEYRKYTASQQSDALAESGDLGGRGGAAPNISGGFDVKEAIGELIVPLVADRPFFRSLQVEGGIRYSSYSVDAPNNPSYNTTTWKAAGAWEPVTAFKFRGNYSRAVRAPNIGELFSPVNTLLTNLGNDPCASTDQAGVSLGRPTPTGALAAVCLAQGAPASEIGQIPQPNAGQVNFTGGGNLNLVPEVANSYSFGAVLNPTLIPGLSGSIDYFNIRVRGAITSPAPADVINACFAPGNLSPTNPACTSIRRNPIDGGLSGDAATTLGLPIGLTNAGRLATDGIDLAVNYTRDFGAVGLSLGFNGTWTNKNEFQANAQAVNRDCVGIYSTNCATIQPEFTWNQRTTVSLDNIDLSLLWRHIGAVSYEFADSTDPDNPPVFRGNLTDPRGPTGFFDFNRIRATNYLDLALRAAATDNLTFSITVSNLLDSAPPLIGATTGATAFNSGNTFPSTYDPLGRRYVVAARLRF